MQTQKYSESIIRRTVTDEMQVAAVRKAVEFGLLPKYASDDDYLRNYNMIREIIQAAIDAA